MTKIFLTGATGYIGGEVLHTLATTRPEYSIRALSRSVTKSSLIADTYPNVTVVPGSLDDAATLEAEAAQADIILNLAATSHLPSAQAIHKGLSSKSTTSSSSSSAAAAARKPHWIQISGASLLAAAQIAARTFGAADPTIHSDHSASGTAAIRDIIRGNPKRAVDNLVLDSTSKLNTALVAPGIIYGEGSGGGGHAEWRNRRSIQVPELARVALERGRAVQVGEGASVWGHVHVRDLARLFAALVEKAAAGDEGEEGRALWGQDGIYFTGVGGDLSWADISQRVARAAVAKGYIKDADVEQLTAEQADALIGHASVILGTNARCEARRARELLGWKPVERGLADEIPETVETEARRLGVASRT